MLVGIGCDIVKVSRFEKNGELLARKILSARELETYLAYPTKRANEFLAGRFAAKEALYKACNEFKTFSGLDFEFVNGKLRADVAGYQIHISISHEMEMAIAMCVVEAK